MASGNGRAWRLRKVEESEERWRPGDFGCGEGTSIGLRRRQSDQLLVSVSVATAIERRSFRMLACPGLLRMAVARAHRLCLVRHRLRLATLFMAEP